ncbi:hypothetical protein MKW98_030292 [Papaver atlanticum]|uniref:Bidirectional sugar transporter SWEET n=1 Tax=Papaver atlanticum TaxID=357466 RepID=A0AAD4TG52_9MAGN|nr:hypothetical protein MKW98_030292 [Papaver atlanticum]
MSSSANMHHHLWAFIFGILGNIVSIMVCLAPLPTFYRIYKKKATEGFQSITYVVSLFSAMLWIYYAVLKTDAFLLITINSIGCVIETIYIIIFLIYAPKNARIMTIKILGLLNFGLFSLILMLTMLLADGLTRLTILGWVCVAFSACVFAAPLSIMRLVIKTKSVEFMPFSLSFFLTLSAILWFSYGLLLKDLYVALPNVAGFVFGVLQMLMYAIYKNKKQVAVVTTEEDKEHRYQENNKLPNAHDHQHVSGNRTTTTTINGDHVIRLNTMGSAEVHPIDLQIIVLDHTHHLENMQQQQVIDQQDDKVTGNNMEVVEV